MRPMTLTVYLDRSAREWRWHLQASNKRIVADSGEGYARKAGAQRAAKRLLNLFRDGLVTVRTID